MALKFGGALDWRATRWLIAERMHWTLDYVDSLSIQDVLDGMDYWHSLRVLNEAEGRNDMPAIMQGLT